MILRPTSMFIYLMNDAVSSIRVLFNFTILEFSTQKSPVTMTISGIVFPEKKRINKLVLAFILFFSARYFETATRTKQIKAILLVVESGLNCSLFISLSLFLAEYGWQRYHLIRISLSSRP